MIKSKKLFKIKEIKHGFFNKTGGESEGIYSSLNCGIGSMDNKKDVIKNLKIACKKIDVPYKNLVLLNQIHSNKFHVIKKYTSINKKKLIGDGLITKIKKIPLGILTADCVPVMIYDKNQNIISAVHAGWKGAYKGVVEKIVKFLFKKGSSPRDLIAVIGPCISIKNYEVKKKFMDKFLRKNKENKVFFKIRKNKTYFSLNDYIYSQLEKLGISKIELINKDTFNSKNKFFSARRSLHYKQNDYGRNISIIMIN